MKKQLTTIALGAILSMTAFAQGARSHSSAAERATMQTERMTKELELNKEQAQKVEAINLKYADRMQTMHGEAQANKREAMSAVRTEKDAELKAVLTPEQFAKYQERGKSMKADRDHSPRKQEAPKQ